MNKYIAIVIAVVLSFLGLIMAYTMTPGGAPGVIPAQEHAAKDH